MSTESGRLAASSLAENTDYPTSCMRELLAAAIDNSTRQPSVLQGKRFGGYELLEKLGHGGMGVVYKARQISADRIVALKLIRPDRLSEFMPESRTRLIERFRNEVQAAAKLEHDHAAPVYDVGEVDGQPYYAMRYIDGESLQEKLSRGALAPHDAARYMEQIAWALSEAHALGVLHRDVKPHNVMIDSKTDRALLVDFGLAKLGEANVSLTTTQAVFGSPPYMSPEQASGSGRISPLSDIYGLGATLYQLLTCRPPFQAASTLEVLMQVKSKRPIRPRLLNPRVPIDLETICLKCLEKDPARRYASAAFLAEELVRFQHGDRIKSRVGLSRRRKSLSAALIGAALAVIVFGVAVFYRSPTPLAKLQMNAPQVKAAAIKMDTRGLHGNARRDVEPAEESSGFGFGLAIGGDARIAIWDCTLDQQGSIYTVGHFTGEVDFDPGLGEKRLESAGRDDAFIAKYSAAGELEWAYSFGGPNYEMAQGVAVDEEGNVWIAGKFNSDVVDFDPGPGVFNLHQPFWVEARSEGVVLKLDPQGRFLRAHRLHGPNEQSFPAITFSKTSSSEGAIYLVGNFWDKTDFEFGDQSTTLTNVGTGDSCICKVDGNGNCLWVKQFAGLTSFPCAVAADPQGNAYLAGWFNSRLAPVPSGETPPIAAVADGCDAFVSKVTAEGNVVWLRSLGGGGEDKAMSIVVDDAEYVYICGYFQNEADFDPGPNQTLLKSKGANDAFICKLNKHGHFLWAKRFGGAAHDFALTLAINGWGNIVAGGFFLKDPMVRQTPDPHYLRHAGPTEAFLTQLTPHGDEVWMHKFGVGAKAACNALVIDPCGNLFAAGNFCGEIDIDPTDGNYPLRATGEQSGFLLRWPSGVIDSD